MGRLRRRIEDPLGRTAARSEFYDDGRLKKVTDADGKTIEYAYDAATRTQWVTDQLGHTTKLVADARGNVVREENPVGEITLRTYDAHDRQLSETIVVGLEDSVSSETNDLTTSATYDPATGDKLTATDPRGNVTTYSYNSHGQVTAVSGATGTTTTGYDARGLAAWVRDSIGNVTSFSYDPKGNLTGITNDSGQTLVTSDYNEFGDVTSTTPAAGHTTYFDYNLDGKQVARWYFHGEGAQEVQILDWTGYDEAGRATGSKRVVLPAGQFIESNLADATFNPLYVQYSTSTTYSAAGQVLTTTDQNGLLTEQTYDPRGQLIQTRREAKDTSGATTWFLTQTVYDAAGRAVVATDEFVEGTAAPITGTRTTFDAAGQATLVEQLRGLVIALDPAQGTYTSRLVAPGTVVSQSSIQYDNARRVTLSVDAYGAETRTVYNAFSEVVQTATQSRGESGQIVWLISRTVYDGFGRAEISTDRFLGTAASPNDVTGVAVPATRTVYDEQGRAWATVRLDGVVVNLQTSGGNLDAVLVAPGTELSRSQTFYDPQGRVSRTIDAAGRQTDFEFDSLGRQTAAIDHAVLIGTETVRHRAEKVYDAEGRLWIDRVNVRQLANGTIDRSLARETTYDYDEYGNLVKTTFADGTFVTALYDARGRKTSETNQLGLTRSFEYDSADRLSAVVLPAVTDPATGLPANPRYEYGYDAQGRQTLIRDPLGRETRFTYDAQGNQLTRTLPLGFGADGLLSQGETPTGDFVEQKFYDARGMLDYEVSFEGVVADYVYDYELDASGHGDPRSTVGQR